MAPPNTLAHSGAPGTLVAIVSTEDPQRLTTPEARLSWPHLFTPRKDDRGKDKWDCVLVLPKPFDKAPFNAIVKAACIAAYGADFAALVKAGKLSLPKIKDGDLTKPDDPTFANAVYFEAHSARRPGIVDQTVQAIPDTEAHRLYAGCYVRAAIRAYAYDYKNAEGKTVKKGISFGLQNVQLLRDGDPLGSGMDAGNDFSAVAPVQGAAAARGRAAAAVADDDDLLGGASTAELTDADLDL